MKEKSGKYDFLPMNIIKKNYDKWNPRIPIQLQKN